MEVRNVIASALRLIGRAELISALSDKNSADAEGQELIETLLYCFNAVEDELARKYIPLTASEEKSSSNTQFLYSSFNRYPVRIKRVTVDGKQTRFEVFTKYMTVQAKNIVVEYEYAPARKTIDGSSDFGDEVGEYLIALGIASEYCVINGEAEMADKWEKKYRTQLDRVQRALPVCANIPPRRWI